MDSDSIARAFVDHYYSTFDTNRSQLINLYQDASMMTFEGEKFTGTQSINQKLLTLPFQQCQHAITTVDSQVSGPGLVVFVSGSLKLGDQDHPLRFSQMFHLIPSGQSFFVLNDIFRLNYG